MNRREILSRFEFAILATVTVCSPFIFFSRPLFSGPNPKELDPTSWGSDHVGKPIPDYVTGDECLFCHRDIGKTWQKNRHQLTLRRFLRESKEDQVLNKEDKHRLIAEQADFVLGGSYQIRFLKRSKKYGHLDMLTAKLQANASGDWNMEDNSSMTWEHDRFNRDCAGCHTTAVDAKTNAFSATSLDCFVCHGNVDLQHTKNPNVVFLSKQHRDPRKVVATCGQCHLRGGKSKSTGRPFAHHFVAEDNLFQDFQIDLSEQHLNSLGPLERHIFQSVRDVLVRGNMSLDCLKCHDIHAGSSAKHQELDQDHRCFICHLSDREMSKTRKFEKHHKTCDY